MRGNFQFNSSVMRWATTCRPAHNPYGRSNNADSPAKALQIYFNSSNKEAFLLPPGLRQYETLLIQPTGIRVHSDSRDPCKVLRDSLVVWNAWDIVLVIRLENKDLKLLGTCLQLSAAELHPPSDNRPDLTYIADCVPEKDSASAIAYSQ